ncbi:single hybrid motif-containing protein [Sparassis latifolia]
MLSARRLYAVVRSTSARRCLHASAVRRAITNLGMPAMSPTMTEGGIAQWKKKEGEAFSAGDVLLEIETDKATIDVEAQDDGVMGKIFAPDGTKNIPVGKVIALLAEEGDDISNLQAPAEEPATPKPAAAPPPPAPTPAPPPPAPTQAAAPASPTVQPESERPLFPSVLRLLEENNIANADAITGTGVRGMLTKGDVLAYLGQASGPLGTFKEEEEAKPTFTPTATATATEAATTTTTATAPPPQKSEEPQALDGPAIRKLIVGNMLAASLKARGLPVPPADFDSIISDYLPPAKPAPTPAPSSTQS